jgi:hypothetical protein
LASAVESRGAPKHSITINFSIFVYLNFGAGGIFFHRQDSACFNKARRFSDWGTFRTLVFWHGAKRKKHMSISSQHSASNWPQNWPTTGRALRRHTDPHSLTTIAITSVSPSRSFLSHSRPI